MLRLPCSTVLRTIGLTLFIASSALAQDEHTGHVMSGDSALRGPLVRAGAGAIALGTVALPGVSNRTLAEGYLTQPLLMAMLSTRGGGFASELTLDFEGSTLKRGELDAGIYGEGYVDRRHPHTLMHQLTATGSFTARLARLSVTAGKGFVPFGTDDPMSRPFVKYPVNHHHAQILERAMIIGALARGPVTLEGSTFNGDEPQSPSDMPNWDRFGDSWSARLTARAADGLEIQGSFAKVNSPEQPNGGGLDQRKQSVSGRFESKGRYLLAEWARTDEREARSTAFTFNSYLAEGSIAFSRFTAGARAERSERPEEERLVNPFRTPRPHSDLGIIGRTRWDVLTAMASAALPSWGRMQLDPFIEISTQHPHAIVTPSAFDPTAFYGASRLWSFSFGARMGIGMKHDRMGRYGVALSQKAKPMHDMEGM